MGTPNPYITKLEPAQLQAQLQRTVKPLAKGPRLHCDADGRIKLFCTRNFERGCIVLRVRVQTAPKESGSSGVLVVRETWTVALLVIEKAPKEVFLKTLDALVDMVRLQHPDRKFVVARKYPGQDAV